VNLSAQDNSCNQEQSENMQLFGYPKKFQQAAFFELQYDEKHIGDK
jgi:hypothetical protein